MSKGSLKFIRPALAVAAVLAALTAADAAGETLRPYRVVGDGIPDPISGTAGDPARGMEVAADRQRGNCILCHTMPMTSSGDGFQGDVAPDLSAIASRLSAAQIRLRLVDPTRANSETVMPAYYRVDGLNRVAPAFRGKAVLTAEEIEDVIAYLLTLR